MTLIHALILGLVEGLTEFLPISSTAHLILTSRLLNLPSTDFQKFFEVFIQGGAILAVVVIYLKKILNKELVKNIAFSFIPTGIIGFLFYRIIKNIFFESVTLIIGSFALVGLLFIILEYLVNKKYLRLEKSIRNMTTLIAIVIGVAQALAVIPGVSRAGIVIVTMMLLGYKRDEAALYSFLLAAPTILMAAGYDLYRSVDLLSFSSELIGLIVVGFAASFISAYLVIRWFVKYLQRGTLIFFAAYRIILAAVLIII